MDIFGENPQLVSIVIAVILLVTGGSLLKWWVEKLASTATTKGERAVQAALKKHGKIKAARVALEYEMFKEAAEYFAQEGRRLEEARAWRKADAWDKAAEAFAQGKDWDSAAFCFRKANDDRGALKALTNAGQFEQAARFAARLSRYDHAAELLVKAGKASEAVELFRKAGANERALELSAEIRQRKGEWEAAARTWVKLRRWDRALTAFEKAEDTLSMAKVLRKLDRYDDAIEVLVRGRHYAEAASLHEAMGRFSAAANLWQRRGELERAIACLTKAGDRVAVFRLRASRGEVQEALRVADTVPPTDAGYAEVNEMAAQLASNEGMLNDTLIRLERLLNVPLPLSKRSELTKWALELSVKLNQPEFGRVLLERLGNNVDLAGPAYSWVEPIRQELFSMPASDAPMPIRGDGAGKQASLVSGAVVAEATGVFGESTVAYVEGAAPSEAAKAFGAALNDEGWPEGVPASLANRYSDLERLGQGGNGVVFRANDKLIDRVVVLKFMIDGAMPTEMARRYFDREVKMAASLSHPNIVHIYDMGNEQDVPWYSMEFIDGLPLSAHLPIDHPVDDPQFAMNIIDQVSAALDHAHGRGMLHRDIKPDNILVSNDGQAKLLDFGLARAFDDGFGEQSVLAGTPFYMAPEQIDGSEVNHKIDIYALGVILFRMFTGRLPFAEGNIFVAHALQPVPDPHEFNPSLHADVRKAVLWCLEKSAEDRPNTCAEVAEMIRGALAP